MPLWCVASGQCAVRSSGSNWLPQQAALVCFEINIFSTVIGYWKDIHPAIIPSILIPLFFLINIWSVAFFGEAEFWLAFGKLILIIGLLFYSMSILFAQFSDSRN